MEKQPVRSFVSTKLVELKRQVAQNRDAGGYASVYSSVAQMLKDEYPDLSHLQKAMAYSRFERDAEMSTHQDLHGGLGSAASILGLRNPDVKPGVNPCPSSPRHGPQAAWALRASWMGGPSG